VNPEDVNDEYDLLVVEDEVLEPNYDDDHLYNKGWMTMLQHKHIMDELLFGEVWLLKEEDEVDDVFIVATTHDDDAHEYDLIGVVDEE